MEERSIWIKTMAAAGGLVVLGSLAYWLEYKYKPKQERKEEIAKQFFDLKDTQIAKFRLLDHSKAVPVEFEFECLDMSAKLCKPSDHSKWQMVAPKAGLDLDTNQVDNLLSSFTAMQATDTLDLSDETPEKRATLLKEYGLENAATTGLRAAEFITSDGKVYRSVLGGEHPVGDKLFSIAVENGRVLDTRILLISNYAKNHFEHDLGYFRNKKIFKEGAHEVQKVTLWDAGKAIVVAKKEGLWTIEDERLAADEKMLADTEAMDSLVSALLSISVKNFIAESVSAPIALQTKKSATKRRFQLEFAPPKEAKDGKPTQRQIDLYEVVLAKPKIPGMKEKSQTTEKSVYAEVTGFGPWVEVDASQMSRWVKSLSELRRQKVLSTMERFSLRKLDLSSSIGGKSLTVEYKDGKWVSADMPNLDSQKIVSLLDALNNEKISSYESHPLEAKAQDQWLLLKGLGEDGSIKKEIRIFSNSTRGYVRDLQSKRKEVQLISKAAMDKVPFDLKLLEAAPAVASPLPEKAPDSQ